MPIRQDGNGWVLVDGTRCDIEAVLTTPSEIDFYADAGDLVATDPTGSYGVKVADDDTLCRRHFTDALAE